MSANIDNNKLDPFLLLTKVTTPPPPIQSTVELTACSQSIPNVKAFLFL